MTEKFLHFIWNMGLFQKNSLKALTGESVEIIKLGIANHDAGPDFLNAQVKINGTLWAGNVEIHKKASDWKRHNHHLDINYDNVILHVVTDDDYEIHRVNGEIIPTIKLEYPVDYLKNYTELEISDRWIPCEGKIQKIDKTILSSWLETMLIDRLQDKTASVDTLLNETQNNWEQVFFITLCRSLGQKVNGLPFELLGKAIPVRQISKYKGKLLQLEAFLFGQAGMLEEKPADDHQHTLQKEYMHLQRKHHLTPINKNLWKYHRLRPSNFPTIRIAQLAAFLNNFDNLLSSIIKMKTLEELYAFLSVEASGYWNNHYRFGKQSHDKPKSLGITTCDIIIMNAIVPFMFSYGNLTGKPELKQTALDLLNEMKPERNAIIKKWSSLGFSVKNAFDSQGVIQLKSNYCDARKCLSCRIGMKIISGSY